MVKLECIEKTKGCDFKTQDLPFNEAEVILTRHLDHAHRYHPTAFNTSTKFPPSNGSRLQEKGASSLQSFYVYLCIDELPAKYPGSHIYHALADAGCPGYISTVDDEAGKYSGAVIVKLDNEEDKTNVLNYDYKSLFHVKVRTEEVEEAIFFKFATKFEKNEKGNNVFIRLKGMEWETSENQIRKFLEDCDIVQIVMTKTPTGRPTGEAYIKLKTEDDVTRAKAHDNEYLGRRFVVVDEIFEEQFNLVLHPTAVEPVPVRFPTIKNQKEIEQRFKK